MSKANTVPKRPIELNPQFNILTRNGLNYPPVNNDNNNSNATAPGYYSVTGNQPTPVTTQQLVDNTPEPRDYFAWSIINVCFSVILSCSYCCMW